MTTMDVSLRSAVGDRAARLVGEHDAVGQAGERVGQREPAAGHRVRAGALHREQREREQRHHRHRGVDGQDRERREAEQDALVGGLAHELAGELVPDARAGRERDDGRDRAGVDDEVHAGRDERGDELPEAEVAVARRVGEELEDGPADPDGQHVLADVEGPVHEALAVDAVGERAGDDLGQRGGADAGEEQQPEGEGRRRDQLALAAAELDGQHLADDDGDGEDRRGQLEVAEDPRSLERAGRSEDARTPRR